MLPRAVHGGEGRRLGTGRIPSPIRPQGACTPQLQAWTDVAGPGRWGRLGPTHPLAHPIRHRRSSPCLWGCTVTVRANLGPSPRRPPFCRQELPGFPSEPLGSQPRLAQPHGPCEQGPWGTPAGPTPRRILPPPVVPRAPPSGPESPGPLGLTLQALKARHANLSLEQRPKPSYGKTRHRPVRRARRGCRAAGPRDAQPLHHGEDALQLPCSRPHPPRPH